MSIKIPKGTKDILPDQSYKWNYVESIFLDLCRKYGFKEIRTPSFEHTELFARGVGDTTDIVEKQMYTFKDYAGRSVTLKPEGTSCIVRSFIEHKMYADVQPSKFCYDISCFRYEKPQSGRLREFHQLGVEVFGTDNTLADSEVITLAADYFKILGIRELELHINSIGCPVCRKKYREALQQFLKPKYDELCDTCKNRYERNPMRILDCKSPICQEHSAGAPVMLDYLCEECQSAFDSLKNNLNNSGVDFTVDPGIVRGLDYYTKTAFEFVSTDIGAQGAVCGGGRYDNLIEEIGGPPLPGVGFALGIERLLLVMDSAGIEIPEPDTPDVFIAVMGDRAKSFGLKLMRTLRNSGLSAEMDLLGRNFKGQFKYADRINAKNTVVIGDNELDMQKVAIKNMKTSNQVEVPIGEILSTLTLKK